MQIPLTETNKKKDWVFWINQFNCGAYYLEEAEACEFYIHGNKHQQNFSHVYV